VTRLQAKESNFQHLCQAEGIKYHINCNTMSGPTHSKFEKEQALCCLSSFKIADVVTNDMGQPKLRTLYFHITKAAYEYVNSRYTIAARCIFPLTFE
jgi:hypothetical protein